MKNKRPIYRRKQHKPNISKKILNKPNILMVVVVITIAILALTVGPQTNQPKNKPEYTPPEGYQKVVPKNSYRTQTNTRPPTYTQSNPVAQVSSPTQQIVNRVTDYSTLKQDLLRNEMIQDLPKSATINLKFYNFDSGQRQWEKSYVLGKNSVTEGTDKGDIQIVLSYKYVTAFRNKDICTIIAESKASNDYAQYTDLSTSQLMWKFKSMLKYRDCLGV